MSVIICVISVALAVITVTVAVDRERSRQARGREKEMRHEREVQELRIREAADRENRAASFYALQSALQTVQRQAEIQGRTSAAAVAALASVSQTMGANDRLALETAAEELRSRAIVQEYTKMLLTQQDAEKARFTQSRPWVR
jgi:hypothetical protein